MAKSPNLSRRDFVNISIGALGTVMVATVAIPAIGYVLGPGLEKSTSEAWIPVGKVADFPVDLPTLVSFTRTKVNGWEKTVNSYGVFVVKPADGEIYVLSNVCTHLSCRVNWAEGDQAYGCPCHAAAFDIEGKVLDGPPPRPLERFETKIEDGTLFILLKVG